MESLPLQCAAFNARTDPMQATDELDLNLLRALSAAPQTTQRGLAQRLGVSLGRINFCLRALSDKGWIKVNNFRRSDRKWAYTYVLTPAGADEKLRLTLRFLQRKSAEYDRLRAELEALRQEVKSAAGATRAPDTCF
jgi:EPS-associated MarR family transcriptional regulator